MKPDSGLSLGDRYRLVSRIAVGGMGEVWVAHDQSLARDVAIKVLREEFAGDEGFLERFRSEARNSAQLSHPNIAQLYDYGEQEGSGFLVMELILGEPMSDLLDREPVLPTRRLLPILASTARALHAAHVAGVVHRDVKPGNILLSRSGRVKITDFGISTAVNQIPMTESGMVMGTAQYLSPEQAIGRAATPASDIYSLGIVAYEALVGHRPFTGPTAVDIAVAHVNTKVPPMPPGIDPELSALVMRMLAKEPEERPRSAASLARVLDEMNDRTETGGIELGRPSRAIDAVDAEASSTGGLSMPMPATPAVPGPRPTGQPATLVPGREAEEASANLPAVAPPSYEPGRSTGTGQRWGQLSRPLIVLILMVLFALLGAAFADRLWGPQRAAPGPAHGAVSRIVIVADAGAPHERGIIDRSQRVDWRTTTARDL
jgi:serine/threonine-protein kinase